jgi:hypothetical protein
VPSFFGEDDTDFGGGRVVRVACVEGGSNVCGFGRMLDGGIVIVMDEADTGDGLRSVRRRKEKKEKYDDDSDVYIVDNFQLLTALSTAVGSYRYFIIIFYYDTFV